MAGFPPKHMEFQEFSTHLQLVPPRSWQQQDHQEFHPSLSAPYIPDVYFIAQKGGSAHLRPSIKTWEFHSSKVLECQHGAMVWKVDPPAFLHPSFFWGSKEVGWSMMFKDWGSRNHSQAHHPTLNMPRCVAELMCPWHPSKLFLNCQLFCDKSPDRSIKKRDLALWPFFHQSKKTSQSYLDSRYVKNLPFGEKAQILHAWKIHFQQTYGWECPISMLPNFKHSPFPQGYRISRKPSNPEHQPRTAAWSNNHSVPWQHEFWAFKGFFTPQKKMYPPVI